MKRAGVRSSAVRMPRTVHNHGEGGFAGVLTDIARQTCLSGYPGDGTQRWPAVHGLGDAVRDTDAREPCGGPGEHPTLIETGTLRRLATYDDGPPVGQPAPRDRTPSCP
ncbi:MAG: hypothetical protein ABI776_07740 [Nocardioidaceae bacterium]